MYVKLAILGMSFLMVLATGCDALPLGERGPDLCDSGGAMLADDFEGEQDCGWIQYNQGGAVVAIEDGAMHISTGSPGEIWWTNPERIFDDSIINVRATQVSGIDDNAYGVICRYQDESNFYLFLISGDGYYAIGKYSGADNPVTYLTPDGQYQASEFINQGAATNNIQASCIGNELSLAVNGQPLITVTDTSFASGDVGMAVSTLQQGTVEVAFDEFRVFAP